MEEYLNFKKGSTQKPLQNISNQRKYWGKPLRIQQRKLRTNQKLNKWRHLTIIPRARKGSESIAHEAEGRMGYWLRGYEGERNNCFSKIQLVGQKGKAVWSIKLFYFWCVSLKKPFSFPLYEQVLETVRSHKVLGLVIQDNLKWNKHICVMVSKASKRLHVSAHYPCCLLYVEVAPVLLILLRSPSLSYVPS